jgi:hypothetical protein
VAQRLNVNGVPLLDLGGTLGGLPYGSPIVDSSGKVVGLVQAQSTTDSYSVDLAELDNGDPTQFCVGDAVGQTSTICPQNGAAELFQSDGPPQVCNGVTSAPPFTVCTSQPGVGGEPTQSTATTTTSAPPTPAPTTG